jgi:Ala-tRNA(Pro) deacylase
MPKKKPNKTTKKFANQLTKLLDQAKVKYNLFEHKIVYTAHDLAQTTKKKINDIAKVVLIKVEGTQPSIARSEATKQPQKKIASDALAMTKKTYFVLIVLPAGKYIDFNGIKKALKAKKVSIASEKDITNFLKTKIGLIHPFGNLYKIQTLLDKSMAKGKKMMASAGSYTQSIEISLKDFEKLAQPIKGIFSKAKK